MKCGFGEREKSFYHFFESKKVIKKLLAVNLTTKNVLISLKILKTLRAKTFFTFHSIIFLTYEF